jgi:hypothetical protein
MNSGESKSQSPERANTGLQRAIADRALERFQREHAPKPFWSAKLVVALVASVIVATVAGLFFDFFLKVLGRYFDTPGVSRPHEPAPQPSTPPSNTKAPYMISVEPPAEGPQKAPSAPDSDK